MDEAIVLSYINLINESCFPIKLIACLDATDKQMEQNATLLTFDDFVCLSLLNNVEAHSQTYNLTP